MARTLGFGVRGPYREDATNFQDADPPRMGMRTERGPAPLTSEAFLAERGQTSKAQAGAILASSPRCIRWDGALGTAELNCGCNTLPEAPAGRVSIEHDISRRHHHGIAPAANLEQARLFGGHGGSRGGQHCASLLPLCSTRRRSRAAERLRRTQLSSRPLRRDDRLL